MQDRVSHQIWALRVYGVVTIRHYVQIVRRNHRGSGLEGLSAQTCYTSKI